MFLQDKLNVFNGRMAKFYYIIFILIAITIIIYLGIDAFYRIVRMKYAGRSVETVSIPIVEEEKQSGSSSLSDYQVIVDRNIFSKTTVMAKKGDVNVDELNLTSLKLVLLGTIAGNKKTSAAFIQDTGAKTQAYYREGDKIQGATIKSILRNKVVLTIGNKDEVLTMEEAESGDKAKASDTAQAGVVEEAVSTATAAAVSRDINISRSLINESLKDLNELLSQATIQPHSTDGEADGLTITGIKAGSIFRRMGLRNGDIIKSVNNDTIKTTEDLISMYNDLKSAPDISIQISRRGQERSFNYSFTD